MTAMKMKWAAARRVKRVMAKKRPTSTWFLELRAVHPTGRQVTTIKSVRVHFDDAPRNENPDMLSLDLVDPSPVAAGAEVKIEYAIDTTRFEGYRIGERRQDRRNPHRELVYDCG